MSPRSLIYKKELSDARTGRVVRPSSPEVRPGYQAAVAYTLQDAWSYLPKYDWGSPRPPLAPIDEAIRAFPWTNKPERPSNCGSSKFYRNLLPRLRPKDYACRRLAIVGSARSVPALAGLLADEKLSNMACFALERIPDSAAEEALIQGLKRVPGSLRISVIQALGNRSSHTAVADLVRLLADEDPLIVEPRPRPWAPSEVRRQPRRWLRPWPRPRLPTGQRSPRVA